MTDHLERRLKQHARGLGFGLCGIAPAADADGFARYEDWLDAGFAGEMGYLHRHRDARRHPRSVLPEVHSVVMLGLEYGGAGTDLSPSPLGGEGLGVRGQPYRVDQLHPSPPAPLPQGERGVRAPSPPAPLPQGERGEKPAPDSGRRGRVAAYARGPDYHDLIRERLNDLAAWLTTEVPGSVARGVVDTAPLLERDFARRAGLGWVGKNTMLIDKHRGSFFFLAALLTDVELAADLPHESSHCGTCTACLDACPTAAFPEPGVLDATKCISYLTIELRTAVPDDLAERVGDWVWGCDVCQDVCPWNRDAAARDGIAFPPDPALAALDPVELLGLNDAAFRRRFRGTVFFRGKRTNLLRNAAIVLGNVGDGSALPALHHAAADADGVIAAAARWAIGRITHRATHRAAAGESPDVARGRRDDRRAAE